MRIAMPELDLVTHPTPSLRERSVEVDPAAIGTPEFQAYLDAMVEKVQSLGNAVGLAAPQVGRNERIIVVLMRQGPVPFINPVIEKVSDAIMTEEEGCFSVPGVWGYVERAKKVMVTALDRHGRLVTFDCKGLEATVFQHEIDHLDGILFIDKVKEITKGNELLVT
jgi:peptide deformylase